MLDKFNTFVALAKYKSFTLTAQHLYCSQPTITQHIKSLEKYYNAQLIKKRNGEVVLTEKGEQFLAYIEKIISLHSELVATMNLKNEENELIIHASHYLTNYFFDELFSYEPSENYAFNVTSSNYVQLKSLLLTQKANFAMMPFYEEDEEIVKQCQVEVLFEEDFVLIVPRAHPFTNRKVVYAKDLKEENVFLPMSKLLQERIIGAIAQKEVSPKFSYMSDFPLIKKAVSLGMGVGFIPKSAADTKDEHYSLISIKGLTIQRQNAFVVRKDCQLLEEELRYMAYVRLKFQEKFY